MFFLVFFFLPQLISVQSADICTGSRPAKNDHKLIGHVMNTLIVPSGSACFDQCRSTTGCDSISYNEETKTCHLNNANHLTNPESLVPSVGFLYMNVNTVYVPYTCSDKYCPDSTVCVYKWGLDKHACLPCEVANRARDRQVLHFPKASISDKVELSKPDVSGLSAFTVTMWFQIVPSSTYNSLFQYLTNAGSYRQDISLYAKTSSFSICLANAWYNLPSTTPTVMNGYWHHVTLTWQSSDGEMNVYYNGTKVYTKAAVSTGYVIGPGVVLLGQEADSYVGSFDNSQAFHGNMSMFHMWDRVLREDEIVRLSQSCTGPGSGNIVRWSELKYKGEGLVKLGCSPFCIY